MHKDYFRVINNQPFHLHGFGDRVAHLLHLEVATPFLQHRNNSVRQEILVVNTHLLFPHDSSLCLERLRQVEYFESGLYFVCIAMSNIFPDHVLFVY